MLNTKISFKLFKGNPQVCLGKSPIYMIPYYFCPLPTDSLLKRKQANKMQRTSANEQHKYDVSTIEQKIVILKPFT